MKLIVYSGAAGGVVIVRPALGARLVSRVTFMGQAFDFDPPSPFDILVRRFKTDELAPVWAETEDEFVARIRTKDVPADAANVLIIEEQSLPDRSVRDAWKIAGGALAVDAGKADAIRRDAVDAVAERIRARYVPQPMVVPEYQQAEEEASAFKAGGYAGVVPPAVAAWAAAKSWTAQQAADDILAAAVGLRGKLMQIRAVRLGGKEAIAAGAKTVDQVVAELEAL